MTEHNDESEWRGYDEERDSEEAGAWDQSHAEWCVYWPDCQKNGDHPNPHTGPSERNYTPGDKALIRFRDGEWRPAELSAGFIWATADGRHWLAAEGGFEAKPLVTAVVTRPERSA